MDTSKILLGRLPVKHDSRNFQLVKLMSKIVKPPTKYSFEDLHPGIPLPMFCNDQLGCCVISARAHDTLRMELVEQKTLITINDLEVKAEYFKETGGADSGLVILDSLNEWRKQGWMAAHKMYQIQAYAQVSPFNHPLIKQTIVADVGLYIGINLPLSAREELNAGKLWSRTTGRGTSPGSWGGHCVLVVGYDSKTLTCVTWGAYQKLSWSWFDKYCDESYAVIDAVDTVKKRALVNQKKLALALKNLAA